MQYEDYLQQGDLGNALSSLEERIRNNPGNKASRIQLLELLSILGHWERGLKQLDTIERMFDDLVATVWFYRTAMSCEVFRASVFKGEQKPVFIGEPEQWHAQLLQALALTTEGQLEQAGEIREQALGAAQDVSGTFNETPFEWLVDADSRIGPTLEVMLNGEYRWVAFSRIKALTAEVPKALPDKVWFPAHIVWEAGGESDIYTPTRYPGSAERSSDLALSRKTDWDESAQVYGQRMFMTNDSDYSLMDLRKVEFVSTEHANDA